MRVKKHLRVKYKLNFSLIKIVTNQNSEKEEYAYKEIHTSHSIPNKLIQFKVCH